MAIDYDKIKNWKFDDMTHTYTERDSMLYALGLGFGAEQAPITSACSGTPSAMP